MASLLTSDSVAIHGRDMFGLTALHKVASWDKADLLHMLLLHSSTTKDIVNAQSGNKDGFTPLHMCVDSGACVAARRLLADSRVDLSATDKKGRTARNLAEEQGKSEFVQILRETR
jgi:ankyrin repeat protein